MADHNFLTDTYNSNTAILDECKAHIAEIILPSEPASQFDDADMSTHLIVQAINSVLPEVSQLFEGQAYMYRFAKKGVCIVDGEYAPKLDDPIEDVRKFISSISSMSNLMTVRCSTNSFIGSLAADVNGILASGIASIELSDYMTLNGDGQYVYDIDSIKHLFGEIKYAKSVTQKDILLIESLLYSCVSGDVIDAENLEMILNASLLATNESNKERFPEMWNWISREMCVYTEALISQNYDILTPQGGTLSEDELELKRKIKSLIMLNDTVKVMDSRAKSIQSSRLQGEAVLLEEYYKDGYDHLSDYLTKNGITGLFSEKKLNEYNDTRDKRIQEAAKAGHISLTFHPEGDTDNLLPYLEFGVGDTSIAFIQEFTSASNTSLLEASEQVSISAAESYLKAFMNEDVEGLTEEEYVEKNYTFNDEFDETLSYIKAIPVIGEAVSLTETMVGAEFAMIDAMTIEEMDGEQRKDVVDSTLDATGELVGKIPDDNPKVKVVTKTIKMGTKIVKTGYDDNEKKEKLRQEYQKKIQENEAIKQSIENIKSGTPAIKQLAVFNGATDESTSGAARYSFSFIYYTDTQEVDTSLMLENN